MRNLLFSLLLPVIFLSCEKSQKEITVGSEWILNKEYTLNLVKAIKKAENGKREESPPVSIECTLSLIDTTYTEDVFRWTYGKTSIPGFLLSQMEPHVRYTYEMNEGLAIIFSTDKKGNFKEVKNLYEIRTFLHNAIDSLLAINPHYSDTSATQVKIKQITKETFSSREQIEQVYLKDIQLLFMMTGITLTKNQPVINEGKMHVQGSWIAARDSIVYNKYEEERNENVIWWTRIYDKKEIAGLVTAVITSIAASANVPAPEIKVEDMDLVEESMFVYNREQGHIVWAKNIRTVRAGAAFLQIISTQIEFQN